MNTVHAVVLAAGKGTRMKSRRPKVLHEICGSSMLAQVIQTLQRCDIGDIRVVINPELREHMEALGLRTVVQEPQLGTGHAVQLALADMPSDNIPVLIVSADMPLVPEQLLRDVVTAQRSDKAALAMATARVPLPSFFGRIVREGGKLARIVEQRDATPAQLAIDEVNAGIYCFDQATLRRAIAELSTDNAQGELYLTDCIAALARAGERIVTVEAADHRDVMGVNNRVELAAARAILQQRILEQHMLAGVTIVDPANTYIDAAVKIEPDTTIHPQTHLHGRTAIGRGCLIGPNTSISNSSIADGAEIVQSTVKESIVGEGVTVGPFAHLRGSTVVEQGARVGNFVEMKNTRMGRGAKASHLSYLGDSEIGEHTNIGAGTITCNYDGKKKHKTKIGKGVFIGSNSSLRAPIEIGDDAVTGAGSVVLHDVPPGERVAGNPARSLKKKGAAEPT
ncbi:MAG TPA: bifunctional UDP-N-acetylglucosamine diphosphorylase/glucosamine-1-phosphate N-acetyltransferase GlmU [Candidatus Eremiobacteraceae bacterium]|nr:bifunctional UDP-N-acetylglucosamine diphosphorylase/glucosamine-1-phosphate N-acetyltransferase GlmU [Candidatus Eremiobacteraceae bacterium]